MKFEKTITNISDLMILTPTTYEDDRGYFFESFNNLDFNNNIPHYSMKRRFVQDNQSISKRGVIRGMHLQLHPYKQAKLVRIIKGKILDVIVDLRKESKTYLQSYSVELNENNKKMLFIPEGCLHGFLSLEDDTIMNYKVTNYWNKEYEKGIQWNDPDLNLEWKLKEYDIENVIVGEKDQALPSLKDYKG